MAMAITNPFVTVPALVFTGDPFNTNDPVTNKDPDKVVLPVTCKFAKLPESTNNVGIYYNYYEFAKGVAIQ